MGKFEEEKKRWRDLFARITIIQAKHYERYKNKNDVLEEALDLLEAKLGEKA